MAILVIDASEGEFETGWLAGGQSKEHALALKSAGVKTIIVAVNKMDKARTGIETCCTVFTFAFFSCRSNGLLNDSSIFKARWSPFYTALVTAMLH